MKLPMMIAARVAAAYELNLEGLTYLIVLMIYIYSYGCKGWLTLLNEISHRAPTHPVLHMHMMSNSLSASTHPPPFKQGGPPHLSSMRWQVVREPLPTHWAKFLWIPMTIQDFPLGHLCLAQGLNPRSHLSPAREIIDRKYNISTARGPNSNKRGIS